MLFGGAVDALGESAQSRAGVYQDGKTNKGQRKISNGGPWGIVPELLFEKKGLIPAVQ